MLTKSSKMSPCFSLPSIMTVMFLDQNAAGPVYGCSLSEHLRRSDREIALVIEECITTLATYAMEEEVGSDAKHLHYHS